MRSARRFAIVLVTAPDMRAARKLATSALKARLVACANIVPRIESHYWWKGKVENSSEVLLLFKTPAARLGALEKTVPASHPYDTAEFLALPLGAGSQRYLEWLRESVA